MSQLTNANVYKVSGAIDKKGDFIGFTFNGIHSSTLNIVRVSEGDRYNESLLPTYTSKVVPVPGGEGMYYFGTNYNQRVIRIAIAFDSLSQSDFTNLSKVFGTREIVPLIFDEAPYKVYNVKVDGDLMLSYICFDEGGARVFKGEGNLQFICYSPFAYSRFKYLEDYTNTNIPEWVGDDTYDFNNMEEWITGSGIKAKGDYDAYNSTTGKILLWNGGQMETDFNLYIPFATNASTIPAFNISLDSNEAQLYLNEITKLNDDDAKIRIDTKTNLITGVDSNGKPTGSIYNQYIEKGNFFKIPVGEQELSTSAGIAEESIDYKFLYY